MEIKKTNKHLNITAIIRYGDISEVKSFMAIKTFKGFIEKCGGENPEISLRMWDLSQTNLNDKARFYICNVAFLDDESKKLALKYLKAKGIK